MVILENFFIVILEICCKITEKSSYCRLQIVQIRGFFVKIAYKWTFYVSLGRKS